MAQKAQKTKEDEQRSRSQVASGKSKTLVQEQDGAQIIQGTDREVNTETYLPSLIERIQRL